MFTTRSLITAMLAAAMLALGATSLTAAQPAKSRAPMSMAQLEQAAIAAGVRATELKLNGGVAEVEGFDTSGRKIELLLDRGTGAVLDRKFDN